MKYTKVCLLASMVSMLMLSGCGDDNHNRQPETAPIDNVAPSITMTDNSLNNIVTNKIYNNISGKVSDDGSINDLKLTIKSQQSGEEQVVKIADDGTFSTQFPLQSGKNDLSIIVVDKWGGKTVSKRTVFVDDVAPSLTLADANMPRVSRTTQAVLTGKASDNKALATVTIKVNGNTDNQPKAITVNQDGTFDSQVELQAGDNEVIVTATDTAGNVSKQTQHIYFGQTLTGANSHTGALVNGKLYAWGRNNFGQVGIGQITYLGDDSNHPISPVLITSAPQNIVSISFNQNHSAVLTSDGKVFTWGSDGDGELGRGDTGRNSCGRGKNNCRLDIGMVDSLADVVAISSGYDHKLALTKSGEVWAFGSNSSGQLGLDNVDHSSIPVKVDFSKIANVGKIIQVIASSKSSYALDDKGQVWAWGSNKYANFGIECQTSQPDSIGCASQSSTPVQVPLADGVKIVELAVGRDHVLALTDMGQVYAWGSNATSQVGYNSRDMADGDTKWGITVNTPTLLPWSKEKKVKHVYANGNTSYVMLMDNKVYPWGMFGETGADGRTKYLNLAEPTDKLTNLTEVVDMGVGALHQIAKRKDGGLFTWGWSFEGSLGGGENVSNIWMYNTPIAIQLPKS